MPSGRTDASEGEFYRVARAIKVELIPGCVVCTAHFWRFKLKQSRLNLYTIDLKYLFSTFTDTIRMPMQICLWQRVCSLLYHVLTSSAASASDYAGETENRPLSPENFSFNGFLTISLVKLDVIIDT